MTTQDHKHKYAVDCINATIDSYDTVNAGSDELRECLARCKSAITITASEMGKIGGAKKSAAKTRACRENAKRPRKKKNKVKEQNQNNVNKAP